MNILPNVLDEKYKVTAPETMQEAPMSDSEEEGGASYCLVIFVIRHCVIVVNKSVASHLRTHV